MTLAQLWELGTIICEVSFIWTCDRDKKRRQNFKKIIDHRGIDSMSELRPLAHLGLARAAAISGDAAKSRTAYQNFFALWKDADADLPILVQAKKEYEQLK